jgi:hypothetical protein
MKDSGARFFCMSIAGAIAFAAVLTIQAQDKPIQFVTSQLESLQLDKLKLQGEVIALQKQLAEAKLSCSNMVFQQDLGAYTSQTLKAHGNPEGVMFDLNTMSWKVQEKKQ